MYKGRITKVCKQGIGFYKPKDEVINRDKNRYTILNNIRIVCHVSESQQNIKGSNKWHKNIKIYKSSWQTK